MDIHIFLDAAAAAFLDFPDGVQINAVLIIDIAVGIRHSNDLGAVLLRLLDLSLIHICLL